MSDKKKNSESKAPEEFDYNAHQLNTTGKALVAIYKAIGEHAEDIGFSDSSDENSVQKGMNKFADALRDIYVEHKVPFSDFQNLSDTIQNTIFMGLSIVKRQKDEFERELLARCVGSRNPGTNKLSPEYMTLGDMFMALKAKQDEQGIEEYFHISPKSEDTE